MSSLVDVGFSTGLDFKNDSGLLRNSTGSALAEGGVYAIDPSSSAADSLGTWKYTALRKVQPADIPHGWYGVAQHATPVGHDGMIDVLKQRLVLCSSENGNIQSGDLLVPIPGKNYLIRADSSLLSTRRPVARATQGCSKTTPTLTWSYFSGINPLWGTVANAGLVDSSMGFLKQNTDIIQSATDQSGGQWATGNGTTGDNSWINLPSFFIERPMMEGCCAVEQYMHLETLIATTQTPSGTPLTGGLELELRMNGVATGSMGVGVGAANAFTLTATGGVTGHAYIEPKFVFRYGPPVTGQIELLIFMRYFEALNSGVSVVTNQSRFSKIVSDHFINASLPNHLDGIEFSWRARQPAVANNYIWFRSLGARYAAKRTGG